jgi:DNA-binding NarL/FixJ family response regulator
MKNLHVIIVAMPGTWQKVLLNNLEAHPSVERVEVVHGSLSAMQLAEDNHPDLILIDSGIPIDETVALLNNIKSSNSDTRSVVLTDTSRQGRRITLAGADFTLPSYSFTSRIGDILDTLQVEHPDAVDRTGDLTSQADSAAIRPDR